MPDVSDDSPETDFYRSLFENAAAGIGRTAWNDGRVLIANARLAEIFGYDDRDEFVRDFVFAEHYPDANGRQHQLDFYQDHPGELVETVFTRKDGSLVYVDAEVRIDIEQGFIDFVIIDVSDRHDAKVALEESLEAKSQAEDLVQTMVENSPIPLSLKDLDGKFLFVNQAFSEYMNTTVDEALGKRLVDLLDIDAGGIVSKADAQVVKTGLPLQADEGFALSIGSSTLQVSKFPVFDADGKVSRIATVGIDITELARARNELKQHRDQLESLVRQRTEALRDSEEVFRVFYEVIPDISMITGLEDGIVKSVNQGFLDTTGYKRDEVVGQSTLNLDLWRDNDDRERLVTGLRQDGTVSNLSADFRKKNGSFWPGIMAACIVQFDGCTCILSTTKDISELRRVQDLAIKANRAKSQFLSSMSHELRTPLNAILGFTQVLQISDKLNPNRKQQKAFENIRKSGEHLLHLINRVLELSRIEAGDLELELKPTDAAAIIEECIEMVADSAHQQSIRIIKEPPADDLPLVRTDAIRTRQILLNLLSNAIKYNREGGTVMVRTEATDGSSLRIGIIDSGIGFGKQDYELIFEPFNRLDKTDSETPGAGIGLAISKQLVEAIGGAIGCSSKQRVGSHFWIDLPVCDVAEQPDSTLRGSDTVPEDRAPRPIATRPQRILYVEDNITNFELMESILEEVENVELLHTLDAESGIELAVANPPDLILMDVSLPGIDGIEAAKILKSQPRTSKIPVVGISAAAMKDDIQRASEAGFHTYTTKPFQVTEFLETIRVALNEIDNSRAASNSRASKV